MSCPECFSGYVHAGEPQGRVTKLHGLDVYVAEPLGEAKGIVVIVPDAFGWAFVNNRVLADTYARKGDFRVYLPDFMNGKAAPVYTLPLLAAFLKKGSWYDTVWKPWYAAQMLYAFVPFIISNSFGSSWPRVQSFFATLRAHEAASLPVGAAGFCWGGKHIMNLAHGHEAANGKPLVDAVYTAHPSNLSIPGEIEPVRKPVSVAIGDRDFGLSVEKAKQIESILKGVEDKLGVRGEVVFYKGAGHGFAVRADPGNEEVVRMAEEAEQQAVKWFMDCFKRVAY